MNVLTSIWKYVKVMVDTRIRIRYLWIPNRGNTRHIYYARHQLLCRWFCASWAKSRIGKKLRLLNWIFSFREIFSTENKSLFVFQTLEVIGWFKVYWNNELVSWDPAEYTGVQYVLFERADNLWVPDLSKFIVKSFLVGGLWNKNAVSYNFFSWDNRLCFEWIQFYRVSSVHRPLLAEWLEHF